MLKDSTKNNHKRKGKSYTALTPRHKARAHRQKSSLGITKSPAFRLMDSTLKYRYELKYLIHESKAAAIARFIKPYIGLDHYSKLQPNGSYPIVSLYLDADNLQLCTESLLGHKNRFKLRVRSYSDDPDYPRFFEIKRRINTVIVKGRARVRSQDVATLLSGRYVPPPQNYKTDIDTIKQFQLYMISIGAKPIVKIRYMRLAYEGDSDNRVRVTFDRKLCYNISNAPDVSLNDRGWQRHEISINNVILEIKFTGRYPAWLNRMAEYFGLRQQSMSKYATSIEKACLSRFCAPKVPMYL